MSKKNILTVLIVVIVFISFNLSISNAETLKVTTLEEGENFSETANEIER